MDAPARLPDGTSAKLSGATPVTGSLKVIVNETAAALVAAGPTSAIDWAAGNVLSTVSGVAANGRPVSGLPAASTTPLGLARASWRVPSPNPVETVTV